MRLCRPSFLKFLNYVIIKGNLQPFYLASLYTLYIFQYQCKGFQQITPKIMSASIKTLALILILTQIVLSEKIVTIIGSNDIHGQAFPTALSRQDTGQKYSYGGLVYMAGLIDILNEENKGNVLYLDGGDQFQGGIQSSKLISWGEIMNDFYNNIGIRASSIGNHEFDFGPQFLFPYLGGRRNSLNLAANIRSERGEQDFLPKQAASAMFQFANDVKIGVIGLTTLETPSSTAAFTNNKFPQYQFLRYKQLVIKESKKLKTAGANAVIIVSHIGDACPLDFEYKNRTKDTVQQPCPQDELTQLIEQLPEGTIHGVVQGHRHRMAHHYRKGIPYIGTINGGYYINAIHLKFDENLRLIDTIIQGPIPVCERVFENTGRCNYLTKQQLSTAGRLVPWKFHNKDVIANKKIEALYNQKWFPKMQPYFQDLVHSEIQLAKEDKKESELANLFTNLLHQAVPEADFAILNPGGFRTEWVPGVIQYQHFYNMNPFENEIQTFQINGSQLLKMLQILQNGNRGFYHTWNIQMKVTYVNNKKGFVWAKFMNGSAIEPTKNYIGVTTDFLIEGGDDFQYVINKVYTPRNIKNKGQYKYVIKPYFVDMKEIKANTLIDPENPRLIVN